MPHKNFLALMKERQLLAQITFEEEFQSHISLQPRTGYIGFDPTAQSLHVGHLLQLMTLARWQECGHRAIAVAGGATAMVGDPTGKSELRNMLSIDEINHNVQKIRNQISKFVDLSSEKKGLLVNNHDWIGPLKYLQILREIGPHFTVNRMLAAECFKSRWEKGLSFLEFNYMILQSYDFLHLHKTQNCTVQFGGDDQWSNMLAGVDLIRRTTTHKAFCATTHLLTTSDGKKMGKTEKGAVWLDSELTSPYEYFQFWRNIEDLQVRRCLYFFTHLPVTKVEELSNLPGAQINEAKKVLAFECTKLVHGEEAAESARATAESLFKGGESLVGSETTFRISRKSVLSANWVDILTTAGIFDSKGEVRRLIQQGGLTIDEQKIIDMNAKPTPSDFGNSEGQLIKKGKKSFFRLFFDP